MSTKKAQFDATDKKWVANTVALHDLNLESLPMQRDANERWDKAKAFDAIVKECQDNPTKSRKWVLSLMKRNLKKAQETV
jgi:hypothetical protein